MQIPLAYGRGTLPVDLPDDRTTVIEPKHEPELNDERAAIFAALDAPVQSAPLREQTLPGRRVTIVHSDITRPMPNERVIPWLLEYLEAAGVRREDITLLNALGTHRPNTRAELEQMLNADVVVARLSLPDQSQEPRK